MVAGAGLDAPGVVDICEFVHVLRGSWCSELLTLESKLD